ncbi:tail protein [Pseudomonas phage PhiPA3]|uniref:Tail protein n=1 Tax=Pseudomonas phage PhiPA3 TaxID=998086 RepID=F8SK42_BPPA3|nr:tail protein [Pseudomonas phage PhiPA3]AEH03592.1 tail protein [Pseudomonas phage PhiPA3]
MGILVANDGDVVVASIAARDEIAIKRPQMLVLVEDATADPVFGGGSVQYIWDHVALGWSPIWSSRKPNLTFVTEEKVITGGQVTADHVVKDNVVLSAIILDTDNTILSDAVPTVSGTAINLGTNTYDGKRLHYTYAYGSLTQLIENIWETKADLTYVNTNFASQQYVQDAIGAGNFLTAADLDGYATETWVTNQEYQTSTDVDSKITAALSGYATVAFVNGKGYQTASDVTTYVTSLGYQTSNQVDSKISAALNGYATQSYVTSRGYITDAANDGKKYIRTNQGWAELTVSFDTYSLLSSTSASGDYVVNATNQQSVALTATVTRNVSFTNGPANRTITTALIMVGAKAPNVTGSNVKWQANTALTDADMGATKTVIVAFWDGIDTWILTKGPYY